MRSLLTVYEFFSDLMVNFGSIQPEGQAPKTTCGYSHRIIGVRVNQSANQPLQVQPAPKYGPTRPKIKPSPIQPVPLRLSVRPILIHILI